MITQTQQGLENWVLAQTFIGGLYATYRCINAYTYRGWKQAKILEKKIADETFSNLKSSTEIAISTLKAADHIQFTRIDELKDGLAKCISREMHDQMQKELSDRMDRFATTISKQIIDGFTQVNSRIDHLADNRSK